MLLASKNAFRDSGSVYTISISQVEWLADAVLGEGEPPPPPRDCLPLGFLFLRKLMTAVLLF